MGNLKSWQWGVMLAFFAFGLWGLVDHIPNSEASPPAKYIIVREGKGVTRYLGFVNYGKRMSPDIRPLWLVSKDAAWKYMDLGSARAESDRYGGQPVPLRSAK